MHKTATLAAALLLVPAGALAQNDQPGDPQRQPAAEPEPAPPEIPWTVGENVQMKWELEDPDLREVMDAILGSYESTDSGYTPEAGIHFHAAPMMVDGLNNAAFFELHRTDDRANSFRFGVIHAYRHEGEPRLRFFDFANADQGPALSGLWLAPYALPTLTLDDLRPAFDIVLDPADWSGRTPHPYPTTRDGAVELTSEFALTRGGFAIADRGYDAQGEQVWGVPEGQTIDFSRFEAEPTVTTTEDGLIILDIIDPEGGEGLESGGEIAVHYTGYLMDGKVFDSSRQEGRDAFRVTIPSRLIQGWNDGLIGLEVGARRRLIIPPHLGYGDRDVGRGLIPANSVLIFDVEAMWLDNPDLSDEEADEAASPQSEESAEAP